MEKKLLQIAVCLMILISGCTSTDKESIMTNDTDLNGRTVVMQNGSLYGIFTPSIYPDSKCVYVDTHTDIPVAVEKNKAEAGLVSALVWEDIKTYYPDLTEIDNQIPATPLAFGFRKDEKELREKFNHFLNQFLNSDEFDNMVHGWRYNSDSMELAKTENCTGGVLRCAVSADMFPYDFIKDGKVVGIEVDILSRFAQSVNMDYEIITMNFASLIPHLASGKSDIAFSMMSISEERAKSIDFSSPWIMEPCVCIVKKSTVNNKSEITSLEDMANHKIGVMSGTLQEIYAHSVKDCKVKIMESISDCYIALSKGKIDGLLTSSISFPAEKRNFTDVISICDTLSPYPLGVIFNKKNVDLLEKYNAFQKEYIKTDIYKTSLEEWNDPETDREMPVFSDDDMNYGTLVLAVAPVLPPYDFIKDGKVVGIEPEMISYFAKSIGMRLEIVDMNFSAIIPYVNSGKADIGTCCACITPERMESVNFANSWGDETSVLVTSSNPIKGKKSIIERAINSFKKNFFVEQRYKLILKGLTNTLTISFISILLGTILGILICLGQLKGGVVLRKSFNLYVTFMRCMPQVLLLMIMYYLVFANSSIQALWVAIIAFALCFGAYTSVIFKSSIESIDKGQNEAGLAMGFSPIRTFFLLILPQGIRRALPVFTNESIGLVKATSIVGYISVFDITRAGDIIRSRTYEAFAPLIIVTIFYFLVIWLITLILKYAEQKSQPVRRKYSKR